MDQYSKSRKSSMGWLAGSVVLSATALIAVPAHASQINSWDVNVDSAFTNTVFTSGGGPTTTDPQSLRWGTPAGSQSGLDLANNNPTTVVTNGSSAANTTLTHINNAIDTSSKTLDTTTLSNEVTLTPSGMGNSLNPLTLSFDLGFTETPNEPTTGFIFTQPAPCQDGGSYGNGGVNDNGCADIFTVDNDSINAAFNYDGQEYLFSFLNSQNGLTSLSSDACQAAGAGNTCLGFETAEGASTSIDFASKITTDPVTPPDGIPVPGPSGVGLFGLALIGLGFAGRRRGINRG